MAASAQESFLKAFHASHPMATSQTFGEGRGPDGRSSYDLLAARVAGSERVLDLGCGDGVLMELLAAAGRELTGLDLSPDSLAVARRRPALADARLVEGRAQRLPFPDNDFDACVSHMALMLMDDVDAVAAEVARVLAPGGTFACALGGGAAGGEAFELFLSLLRPVLASAPPHQQIPSLGDRRTRNRAGLDEILGPAGFAPVSWETVVIDLSAPAEQLWPLVSCLYDVLPLPSGTLADLRAEFTTEAAALARADGTVPCGFRLHIATASLLPPAEPRS
ncbi:class I SAM-dependent methyltransferase [Allokutzneria sp. NRRL B-24872]|uniref:class I SAM-dependent methyltransferase n=1 Tax=Allokutzneria sp. NRRL B-24872 TaxID=1137961 RepID=UPI000A36EA05|nr:class I SAM-dependent methyltransferase [Allokutzneria sp. NRRL B-24872]